MQISTSYADFAPILDPMKLSGAKKRKLTHRIIQNGYEKGDGTSELYLQIYQGRKKKIPLNISVPLKSFDQKKQRVKKSYKYAEDYNLLIQKVLSDVNEIRVSYRLNNRELNMDELVEALTNPTLRICFLKFYEKHLHDQQEKGVIKKSTHKQQKATLQKLYQFRKSILFCDINKDLIDELRGWLKRKKKNKPATIEIVMKNFKKYLHLANQYGIVTELDYTQIKVKKVTGNITFLTPDELKTLYKFCNSEFIIREWQNILKRYLFSCFTGIRLADSLALTKDNFIYDILNFKAQKTDKNQQIKLNKTALSLVELPQIFDGEYSEQYINRTLKEIAKACRIEKRLYFHSSRHTFATNYLIAGGQIRNLQKALGHSKIETTMIYAHVVKDLLDKEMELMDNIVN